MWNFAILSLSILAQWVAAAPQPSNSLFNNVTVFTPPASWTSKSTSYARMVLLDQNCEKDNVLLATFSSRPPGAAPYFPIFKSTDLGRSWTELSQAFFTGKNYTGGTLLQPFLYELPQAVGAFPAGTVLLTGNGITGGFGSSSSSTNIELYASKDKGSTWNYVSTVATGGAPNTTNGATPIWEPFIMMHDNQLGVFYSDQRDPLHGQKLAHQTSTDLESWGPVVNDVAYANYTLRPGMTTIAKLGNGQFMISFELAFAQEDPIRAPYAVHYKIADSPFDFDAAPPQLLNSTDGTIPSAGPYTVWTPVGGPDGTIVVSDSTNEELFLNKKNGDPSAWVKVQSGHGVGYTRALRVMPQNGEDTILLANGGMYGESSTIVTVGDFSVPDPGPWPINGPKDTISNCGAHQ